VWTQRPFRDKPSDHVPPRSVVGQVIAIFVMVVGIGFLSVLTATIASGFVKTERGEETKTILATLARIESELAELRQQMTAADPSR
jgi:hypothetical protein